MRLGFPILFQVAVLALAAVIAGQSIALAFFLLRPPPVPQIRPSLAIESLRSPESARAFGMERALANGPPPGGATKGRDLLLAIAIAGALERPLADINVRTLDPTGRDDSVSSITVKRSGSVQGSYSFAGVGDLQRLPEGFLKSISDTYLEEDALQPTFQVSLRTDEGWLTVSPDASWLTLWRNRFLLMLGASLLLLAPVTWWVARRITIPVRALADVAKSVGSGQMNTPAFPVGGPSEIAATGEALNAMRARLASHAAQRTRMLTAVAHDLRTPLTALRLRMELAPLEVRERLVHDIRRMEAMITEIMSFSHEQGATEPEEHTELRALVLDCIEAGLHEHHVRLDPGPEIYCHVPPIRMGRAIGNLIDNAQKYAGGALVRIGTEGRCAVIQVLDEGPGIPEAELLSVLEPFHRGESSRNRATGGIGLGLAIAHEGVIRSGGSLLLTKRNPKGLMAEIRLPIAV